MLSQRDAFKAILPDFRDFAAQVFNVSKDLNFQETASEFNNKFMSTIASYPLSGKGMAHNLLILRYEE